MKRILSVLLLLISCCLAGAQTFSPPVGICTLTGGVYNLTPASLCGGGHKGAFWCTTTVDFASGFILTYQASLDAASGGGADGIDVSFGQNITATSINATDAYLGYYNVIGGPPDPDFNNSFGIEFDIYDNSFNPYFDDPPGVDHTAICLNAVPTTPLAGPVPISPTSSNAKDGIYHDYKITWCPTTNTLQVIRDGVIRLSSVYNYASVFTTPTAVHWGFSGGTGAACSNQLIKNITLVPTCTSTTNPCLTNTLVINTGYDPIAGAAIPGGANGAAAVPDPHWKLTAVTPGIAAGIAVTPIVGLVEVAPSANADVITTFPASWASNPAGNPGGWISCVNSNTYNTPGTGSTAYEMTLGREFRMCADDSIKIDCYIANDNYISSNNIDGVPLGFSQPPSTSPSNYNVFTYFTKTVFLTAGTHFLNFVVVNYDDATLLDNPSGLNVYGTVASATGTSSLVSESTAACYAYVCDNTCNTLTVPDTLHLCVGDTATIHAVLSGPDTVLSYAWSPATGLSSSTILNPVVTASTSGWYYLTVTSVLLGNLVVNGDFSAGNTGFTSSYSYVSGAGSLSPPGVYAIDTDPYPDHPGATSFYDHTTGSGNMMSVNGASTPISVWCETIPVLPNTDYVFSAWVANWYYDDVGPKVPVLQFMINGTLLSVPDSIIAVPGVWNHFYATWNSGVSSSANICINDLSVAFSGNDFALDDITFRPICVTRDSVYITVCQPNNCDTIAMPDSLHLCFSDTATIHATMSGPDSILNYSWSPATGLSSSTMLSPVVTASTSGWYYLTLNALIADNLVVNGDFSAGNTGFSSSYIYSPPPSSILNEGYYSIYNNPNGVHSGFTSFGDHTTGTGNMLIINGGATAASVWCQTIPVTPNTDYDFSAWFADCSSITVGAYVPVLQFQVNGVLLGTPTPVTAPVGTWMNFFSTWNSGTNTTATICIYDALTATTGNDFVIDDISFKKICTTRDSVYVKVNPTTYVNTSKDTSVCLSSVPITLNAPASYTMYHWSTGAITPSIIVSTPGIYWVSEYTSCLQHDDTTHVTFLPSPVAISGGSAVCVGSTITLSDIVGGGLWSGGGTVASVSAGGTVTGLSFGTINATYTLPGGCYATAPVTVVPYYTGTLTATVCPGSSYSFGGSAITLSGVYTHTFTTTTCDSVITLHLGTYTLSVTPIYDTICNGLSYSFNGSSYTASGDYPFVTPDAHGCDSTAVLHLSVKPLPPLPAIISPVIYCIGSDADALVAAGSGLNWYTASTGGVGSTTAPVPSTATIGSILYYVSQTIDGCEGPRAAIDVVVDPLPIATITADRTTICQYDSVSLTAGTVVSGIYSWSTTGAAITSGSSSTQNIELKFNNTGNYPIILTVTQNGICTAFDTVTIHVQPAPTAAFYVKPDVCVGDTITVATSSTTSGVTNCIWNFEDAVIVFATDMVSGGPFQVKWNTVGIHFIQMYAEIGECASKQVTDTVDVHPLPNAQFTNLITSDLCTGDSILLLAVEKNPNNMYQWSPAHFFNNNNTPEIYGKIERQGYVMLDVTTEFGCHAEDSLFIKADPCCEMLFPNAFTPNGDGLNDIFRPVTSGHHEVHTFMIANRWGQIVYETTNERIGWNGYFNGVPQELDVYFYYIRYNCDGREIEQKGEVNLVR